MYWLLIVFMSLHASIAAANSSGKGSCGCHETDLGIEATFCAQVPVKCAETKYRSCDGSCNNLERSWWGTPFTPYRRLLCNSHCGRSEAIHDKNLPNPRTLSLRLFVDLDVKDKLWTLLFMQYGQIVAHDLSLTAGVAQTKKDAITCCTADGQLKPEAERNPRCDPIPIPEDDPYNAPEGITCMDFIRVETTKDGRDCVNATEVPQPLTAVTAYLDVSYLYGNDAYTAKKVREMKGGLLASVERKEKIVLPQDPTPELTCNVDSHSEPCFYTGDVRVNQNPQLALLHIIYMVHHNVIAKKLAEVNPHWNDEILFQETRRIVIATHQRIIYHEFLPGMLGNDFLEENNIYYPDATGYIKDYDPSISPGVSNEFSACVFRTFHTNIEGMLRSMKESRNTSDIIRLSNWFNKPSVCEYGDNFNGLTRGLATQPQSAMDRYVTNDVLNLLFKTKLLGLDLKAIDIQRGRDQGVCPCAKALRAFKLLDPKSFKDFEKIMEPEKVAILASLYKSHEDVDLCTCVFLETRLPGSLVGPLTQRIMGDQFYRSRVADRYFFENGYGKYAFTIDQLNEIRNSTAAEILCYNKDIKEIQPEVFKQISEENALMSCKDIHKFNALAWKETKDK